MVTTLIEKGRAMRYTVLGQVTASDGDRFVHVGGPQQYRLLAVLIASRGRSVSPDHLVDALWPDGLTADRGIRSIHTYVSRLRSALGVDVITTSGTAYALALDAASVDAIEFEDLISAAATAETERAVQLYDTALALWSGPAYAQFAGEWWALADAGRLEELRLVAIEQRAGALLALGRHDQVIPDLDALTAAEPLRERPVALLMQALLGAGRQAESLRVFQSWRTRYGDETGLEPSAELIDLERSIAAGHLRPGVVAGGRLLRGYVVHEMVGEGGYGRVYAATQPGTEREVAIKVISRELADRPAFVRDFEVEAQLVARLEHPHIVPLYDYWREPGGAYLVFRLLRGGTASESLVTDGPWSVARVSRLVEEIGGALLSAHTAGVVHCDVRPANVLFDESGNAFLTDFGIARVIADDDDEDADEPAGVHTDINEFGRLLWELLAGAPPFEVGDRSTRRRSALGNRLPSLL
ncbi:MAG: BTAD domain-containing putative transcriptional regulator, partial [Aeromicrobium sp.]